MISLVESLEAAPSSKWAPIGGARNFGKSLGIIITTLILAIALSSTIGALICCLFRQRNRGQHPDVALEMPSDGHSAGPPPVAISAVVFSTGENLPVVGATECAICLLEYADGDNVHILPNCGHGFHVRCIDVWISSQPSCPTCRKSSLPQPERLATDGV